MIKPLVAVTPTFQSARLAGSKTGATTFFSRNDAAGAGKPGAGSCDALVAEGVGDASSPVLSSHQKGAVQFSRDVGVAATAVRRTVQRPILFPIEGWIEFWRDDVFGEPPKTARETRAVPAQRLKDIS